MVISQGVFKQLALVRETTCYNYLKNIAGIMKAIGLGLLFRMSQNHKKQ